MPRTASSPSAAPAKLTGEKALNFGCSWLSNWRKIMGDKVRFKWVGVGTDEESDRFREMIQVMRLDGAIELIAKTPDPLPRFMEFDIFALTSWMDPFPLVVLESMMLRKPVVCFVGAAARPRKSATAVSLWRIFTPRDGQGDRKTGRVTRSLQENG